MTHGPSHLARERVLAALCVLRAQGVTAPVIQQVSRLSGVPIRTAHRSMHDLEQLGYIQTRQVVVVRDRYERPEQEPGA